MSQLSQYLSGYFGILHPNELEVLGHLFTPVSIKKGDFLVKQGRYCPYLGFIQTGLLRIYTTIEEKEITQWISKEGDLVTELTSFLFDQPARWYIQALTDTELIAINRETYRRIGQVLPRWHELERLLMAKCFTILEDRVFSHLSMSAEERYQMFYAYNSALFNQVPLQYIASLLGMTPETLSRIRKQNQQRPTLPPNS
jgi:CRP/FNR family transcriptional regulator, anaerobic regulatory protein